MNSSPLNDVSALLTLFEQSAWGELHVRSGDLEVYISRKDSGHNPMQKTPCPIEEDPVNEKLALYIESPHLGTFVSDVKVGSSIDVGERLGCLRVLDDIRPILSSYSGTVIEVLAKQHELVEYGQNIFQIQE